MIKYIPIAKEHTLASPHFGGSDEQSFFTGGQRAFVQVEAREKRLAQRASIQQIDPVTHQSFRDPIWEQRQRRPILFWDRGGGILRLNLRKARIQYFAKDRAGSPTCHTTHARRQTL